MIKSMTGFGRGESNTKAGYLTVEVKSVNSRVGVITVKLDETLPSIENQISSYIRSRISRGQINVSVILSKDGTSSARKVIIDRELAKEYYRCLKDIRDALSISEPISLGTIASLPGIVNVEETSGIIDEVWAILLPVLETAVDQLIEMRMAEGAVMLADLSRRLEAITQLLDRISARAPEVIAEYRKRLRRRIDELLLAQITIDEARLAIEVAIMAERCDITEEIIRIRSHIRQMNDCLRESDSPIGRRLDFILQEINREITTIASKSSDVQIAADCISFRDEIEKIREQVQNIE